MAEGVPTNNQRGQRSGPCRLWGGFDKARHIVPTALLVRVQCFRNGSYKAVEGPSTRPIVLSMITGTYMYCRRRRRLTIFEPDKMKFGVSLTLLKPRSHRQNVTGAFPGAVKKKSSPLVTVHHRWTEVGHRRIRSANADGPSYRSESFELHKILRAVRSGQFSAPAKFTYAPTTPSQSLAPLDESSRTLGSARPRNLERWTTAASPPLPGRWSNVAQTLVERLYAFYERTRDCWNGVGRWSSDPQQWWTLVWRWYGGVIAGPEFGYK